MDGKFSRENFFGIEKFDLVLLQDLHKFHDMIGWKSMCHRKSLWKLKYFNICFAAFDWKSGRWKMAKHNERMRQKETFPATEIFQ